MNINGKQIKLSAVLCLVIYYAFARHLPSSIAPLGGCIKPLDIGSVNAFFYIVERM